MKLSQDILRKTVFLSVEQKLLNKFKRRALATSNEIYAYILGDVYRKHGAMCIKILDLHYPEVIATEDKVTPVENHPDAIGSIHSHPNVEYIAQSADDFNTAIMDGEKIYGIYSFGKIPGRRKFSSMDWYAPGRVVVVL